jgi:hypothetical protein
MFNIYKEGTGVLVLGMGVGGGGFFASSEFLARSTFAKRRLCGSHGERSVEGVDSGG